eukprot:1240553-Pleurochrysis_carterae.AAC.1
MSVVAGVSQLVTVDRADAGAPADAGGGELCTGGLLEDVTAAASLLTALAEQWVPTTLASKKFMSGG